MIYCQAAPNDHRACAAYAATFARPCGHEYYARTLACTEHAAVMRIRPRADHDTVCEQCGQLGPLVLVRLADVFEEELSVAMDRETVEHAQLSRVTIAYDEAYRTAADRGWEPVTAYRAPVRWRSGLSWHPAGAEMVEALVTVAVTRPMPDHADAGGRHARVAG
ncbi:MAG TPA: hypothetical protein VHN80_14975 [Kineosporiaceae bacterium]|nr:hypothetical protein [Kineosporiaceae bacterium]